MKYVFNFPLQLLFKMFFTLINFWHFMLKIHVETHLGCHANCSLKFSTIMKMEMMWQFLYNSIIFFMKISPLVLEGVGDTLLCNIGIHPQNYTVSQPKGLQSYIQAAFSNIFKAGIISRTFSRKP